MIQRKRPLGRTGRERELAAATVSCGHEFVQYITHIQFALSGSATSWNRGMTSSSIKIGVEISQVSPFLNFLLFALTQA